MFKFEDKIACIDELIQKNKGRWHLSNIGGFGFEDVAQTIRIHIYNKWDQWDQKRPFERWCNRLIINQIKNLVRNHYYRDAPPCTDCSFNRGGDLCGYTPSGIKCEECVYFKKWVKKKKNKHLLTTATSMNIESAKEIRDYSNPLASIKLEHNISNFHQFIEQFLNAKMKQFYRWIYVETLLDSEIITRLKKVNGKGITKRQLITIRKNLHSVAKRKIADFDPDHDY